MEALKLGIRGVFAKSQPIEAILCAIRIVLAGGFYCPRQHDGAWDVAPDFDAAVGGRGPAGRATTTPSPCSRRASERFWTNSRLGRSNKVIAAQLGLSENTVKMHIQRIMRKLQVQNRTEIVVRLAGLGPAAARRTLPRAAPVSYERPAGMPRSRGQLSFSGSWPSGLSSIAQSLADVSSALARRRFNSRFSRSSALTWRILALPDWPWAACQR